MPTERERALVDHRSSRSAATTLRAAWLQTAATLLLLAAIVASFVASSGSSTVATARSAVTGPASRAAAVTRHVTLSSEFPASSTGHAATAPAGREPTTTPLPLLSLPPSGLAVWPSHHMQLEDAAALIDALESHNDFPGLRAVPRPAHELRRFLTAERFYAKYGLTNLLMTLAALAAYASYDTRAIVLPRDSPTDVEALLDLNATQQRLAVANVVFVPWQTFVQLGVAARLVKVRQLRLDLGSRMSIGSVDIRVVRAAFARQKSIMRKTRHYPFLAHRDFFLSFPFYATAPLDLCFYLRRMVFAPSIRSKAKRLVRALLERRNFTRVAAVHLRIEHDAAVTLRRDIQNITGRELRRFMEEEVVPLARRGGCDGIYVCAGRLKPEYLAALSSLSMPVATKAEFPDIDIPLSGGAEDATVVTSHHAAAVDLLMLQIAGVAVGSDISTFANAALSKRCPAPNPGANFSTAAALHRAFATSPLLAEFPPPPLQPRAESGTRLEPERGLHMYGFETKADGSYGFTTLRFAGCHEPLKRQCFYHAWQKVRGSG